MTSIIAQINNVPAHYKRTGLAIASDEHDLGKINYEIARIAACNEIVVDYPGEDFYVYIWHISGEWIGEVWKVGAEIGYECKPSIEVLITTIRRKYGEQ